MAVFGAKSRVEESRKRVCQRRGSDVVGNVGFVVVMRLMGREAGAAGALHCRQAAQSFAAMSQRCAAC